MDTINTEVLIIGAGAAGIRAAVAASEAGVEVLMVSSGGVAQCGSTFSDVSKGWGIQSLVGLERTSRNFEAFYDDIIHVGLGLCDSKLVRILVEESGQRLENLIDYGLQFRKNESGDYFRAKGCFSEDKRAFITADFDNIRQSLLSVIHRHSIRIVRGNIIDLIVSDGACWGAWVVLKNGEVVKINSESTILAAGGGAGLFKDHLASDDVIGDGYVLAYRAGAELINMEFIQFMLGLKKNGMRKFLPLTEVSRPNMILDSNGQDVLENFFLNHQQMKQAQALRLKHMPFSCRDMSGLVDIAIAKNRVDGMKLFWGGNESAKDKFEVVHYAHAFNGGVKINDKAESRVDRLFAAGEVAAGPHGADRIGGCMMTATQVFGRRAGYYAAECSKRFKDSKIPEIDNLDLKDFRLQTGKIGSNHALSQIVRNIKNAMQSYVSVIRYATGLKKCLSILSDNKLELEVIKSKRSISIENYTKIRNMIIAGKLIVESALSREGSIGSHYRIDFQGM